MTDRSQPTPRERFEATIEDLARLAFARSRFGRLHIQAYGHPGAWDELEQKLKEVFWQEYLAGFYQGAEEAIASELQEGIEWG